jgi:hypothetical protein
MSDEIRSPTARAEVRGVRCGQPRTLTTNPATHTIPLRLSTVSGEKMNRFADRENRKGSDEWRVRSDVIRSPRGAEGRGRRAERRERCTFTINPAAHTTPLRLSTVSGGKMNQLGASKITIHKSQIANRGSQITNRKSLNDPMARSKEEWRVTRIRRSRKGNVG